MSARVIALARPLEFGLQIISQVRVSHSQVDNPKSFHLQLQGRLHNGTTFSFGKSLSCFQKLSSPQQDYRLCLVNFPFNFHQQLYPCIHFLETPAQPYSSYSEQIRKLKSLKFLNFSPPLVNVSTFTHRLIFFLLV